MAPHKTADPLDQAILQKAVEGQLIGSRIEVLSRTLSTNDEILERARHGAGEGLVIFAEEQTAGRGQRGNKWESIPAKSLLFSILLEPRLAVAESARLTEWAAQAVATTIQQSLSVDARIKLPNDIYIGAGKVAGVLVEMRVREKQSHIAIAGIGINVNQGSEDFSAALRANATSLALASGREIDRRDFAVALLRELEMSYARAFAL